MSEIKYQFGGWCSNQKKPGELLMDTRVHPVAMRVRVVGAGYGGWVPGVMGVGTRVMGTGPCTGIRVLVQSYGH